MPKTVVTRLKPFLQPFEKKLAMMELQSLTGRVPHAVGAADGLFEVHTSDPLLLKNRLAFWETVSASEELFTEQTLKEATVNLVRNGIPVHDLKRLLPFQKNVPIPNRRCLRYASHGIHEYRGKFFPQLVISLLNHAGIKRGDLIGDPMCGSGTTLVETSLAGFQSEGIDMNPLSAFMTATKCSILASKPDEIESEYLSIRETLLNAPTRKKEKVLPYFSSLPARDQEYLSEWLSQDVLCDLDVIAVNIDQVEQSNIRSLFRICLSNIIRRVSWQKNDDLRVRREINTDAEIDPIKEFLEEAGRSVRLVLAFLRQSPRIALGKWKVENGDARDISTIWKGHRGGMSAVITSPPYATALPYLDTDRLSLIYLKLLPRSSHRETDTRMIGNREISTFARKSLLAAYENNRKLLPLEVCQLIDCIDSLNKDTDAGFRRQNLPALLSKYFLDMRSVLCGVQASLKRNGKAYFVVGNNHTIAGGERVDISTIDFLRAIGESIGLHCDSILPMEVLVSRDIFRHNAIDTEGIIFFSNKSR